MNTITLQASSQTEVTVLSNCFIDNYMPQANGEFVKVYIYLLRSFSGKDGLDLEAMADRLLCTERDLLRALKYWEHEDLLTMQLTENLQLTGICLHAPKTPQGTDASEVSPQISTPLKTESVPADTASSKTVPSIEEQSSAAPTSRKASLTPDRVKELKQNDDIIQLLYITEQYLGKTLTPTEMQKVLFFYDELKLSPDLIEYLIEYCVSRSHKSMRYIETVALAWAKEGITTVKMAKEANSRYSKDYYTILKAMGINNRNPVEDEIALMDTWISDYGFTMDIIQEACSRTVILTGQPSFPYADKILAGWKKKNVKGTEDIRLLDAQHKKRQLEKAGSKTAKPQSAPNRFNNFHQRDYDFEEYEKKLLNQ